MKHLLSLITLAVFAFLFYASAPAKKVADPVASKQTFTFDYTPKEGNKPGSASMVLAFMRPYYAASFTLYRNELFQSFGKGLASDIEELIIAKGFTLKGPYQGYDEMVFDDKKSTEMVISIEINPEFTAAEGEWTPHQHLNLLSMAPSYNTYSYAGKVSLVGKINLSGVEPLTNEKIWSKSVSIPNVENIQIVTSGTYESPVNSQELMNDPSVYNAVGKALQAQYNGIMDKVSAHFSVEEFNTLKSQIKELKSKKGF